MPGTLQVPRQQSLAATTLELVADRANFAVSDLRRVWPEREALMCDNLCYHSDQIESLCRQALLDNHRTPQQTPGTSGNPGQLGR